MKRHLSIKAVALLCGGLLGHGAFAAEWFKPGLWEETTVKDGITNHPKGHLDHECWTAAKIAALGNRDSFWKLSSKGLDKSCTLKSYEFNGKTLSYAIACKAGSGMMGKLVAESSTHLSVATSMNFGGGWGSAESSDRWLSADCGEHADEPADSADEIPDDLAEGEAP